MKKLSVCLTPLLAMTVSAFVGSGPAIADDVEASDPASDTVEQIVAVGKADRLVERSVTVNFADLNLEKEEGAVALYKRLQRASETVCDVREIRKGTRCLSDMRQADECYHRALSGAVKSVGSDMLTSIHHEREPSEMLAAKAR